MKPHIEIDNVRAIRDEVQEQQDVFRPFVEFWRDDHLILAAHSVQQDVSHTMAAIEVVVPLLAPTHLAMAMDVNVGGGVNPGTGEMWVPGEMEEAREKGLAAAAAVEDAIMLVVASADDVEATLLPYAVIDGKCQWRQDKPLLDGWENSGGRVMDLVRAAYAQRGVRETLMPSAADFDLTPKIAAVHLDAVAIKMLLGTGQHHIVVGTTGDEEWDSTLAASLEQGPSPEELRNHGGTWN